MAGTRDLTEIMDKIRKALALAADKGATPAEAAAAAAMAQKLMFKYNIAHGSLNMDADAEEVEAPILDSIELAVAMASADFNPTVVQEAMFGAPKRSGGEFAQRKTDQKLDDDWRKSLVFAIATYNFCKAVMWGGSSTTMSLVGTKGNIQLVRYLYTYLEREIRRLSISGYATHLMTNPLPPSVRARQQEVTQGAATQWRNDFCFGAVDAIRERLRLERQRNEEEHASSMALVVAEDRRVEQAFRQYFPNVGSGHLRRGSGGSAYGQGVQAGKNIAIRPGVAGPARQQVQPKRLASG